MALRMDRETAGHCALAALGVADRELRALGLEASQVRNLDAAISQAREHVAEILDGNGEIAFGDSEIRPIGARPAIPASWPRCSLADETGEAWAAAAALRQAEKADEANALRSELRRIARATSHDRVRRLCQGALSR